MRCPCCGWAGPCYCFRNRPARPRNTARQRPRTAYRQPPRSNGNGGGIGVLIPAFLLFVAGFWPFFVWHGCKYSDGTGLSACGSGSQWTWNGQSWAACGIWWGLIVLCLLIVGIGKHMDHRSKRPPKGRLRVEAAPPASGPPMTAMPPACLHQRAVPVNEPFGPLREPGKLVAWLCLDCDSQLDPGFRASELAPDATWPKVRL